MQSTTSGAITFLGPAACEGGFVIHDEETFTSTDDGDQIHVSSTPRPVRPARMGVYQILGPYIVSGRTGRFAVASGQGTTVCQGNFNNKTFSFTLKGTISRSSGG